jgi:hypothetical protein
MSLNFAQMGMATVNAYSQYDNQKTDQRLAEMSQKYNNTMRAISTAQSQNAMTESEAGVRDAAVRASQSIQLQSLKDKAGVAAGAAAAGVTGGSVRMAMMGMERSKLNAQAALKERMKQQARQNLGSRRNLAMSAAYSTDVSVIPRASIGASLLGLSANMLDIYDRNTPEGTQIKDTIASWGRKSK